MIIFFTEEDLESFGTFMVSELREELYKQNPAYEPDSLLNRLSRVNPDDIDTWLRLINKSSQN